jgi:hypothetical protein
MSSDTRQALADPSGHRPTDRQHHDPNRPDRPVSARQTAYDKGIKVSDAEMARLNITPANFHGEWNYTIAPRKPDD